MVVVPNHDGKPRRTVDLKALKGASVRQTPFMLASRFPHDVKKTSMDAFNGYHGIKLHEGDAHYTTFITIHYTCEV